MKHVGAVVCLMACWLPFGAVAFPAAPDAPSAQQAANPKIDGATVYELNCQVCHGPNMVTPGGGVFDLRKFPVDDKERFVNSVLKGKNAMPAWQGILKAADTEALWDYVRSRGQ
jgi:mono/diheme cytochrome c family protein